MTFSKKLEEFIGREAILQDVRGWMQDEKFHIVFFSGEYGIGKTRLLQQILDLARRELKYDGAPDKDRIIDLYHFRHHSPEGLARAIFKCFEQIDDRGHFNPFITAQRRLDEARAAGDGNAIREQLQELLKNCVDGLKKMSKECGVLLLFDTVEQFVYPTGTRFAPAWDWLKGWIGDLPRGAVLFAGRPGAQALFEGTVLPQLARVPLGFFTLEESRAYVLKTGKNWSDKENRESFEIDENDIPKLHALSQGRPILLAIFLELRMHDPQAFKDLSGLQKETFEQKVIEYLLNQPELGETLKAAGRAPKGINAELLAKIRGISLRDAKHALEKLKEMSFAKIFPDEDRIYLHDDMYDLLDKYTFSDVADAAERQDAAQAIYNYYKQAIKQKDGELKNIFANLTQEVDFKHSIDSSSDDYVKRIRALETSRQQLKTEFLYYRLRYQIAKGDRKAHQDDSILAGLKNYYRFGHEAATSNNDEILIPLQIELTNFWLSLNDGNFWKPFIEGLLLTHEIWLKVATGQLYLDDIPDKEKNLFVISNLIPDQKTILHALLETWLGTGLVFAKEPEYDRAEKIFTSSADNLQKLSVDQHLAWFRDVVVSLVYRQRAYMRRIRGAFQDSIEDFKSGLRYSRSIDFFHEEATLRNDLGFAQMQAGIFQSAFENMWDGLQLRYRVAIGHRIALSYSSLAQLFIATGAYEEARKYAKYAYGVAGAVGFRRGLGFGNLAYAEATRRYAFSAQGPANQAEYLQQAQDAIDIAIHRIGQLGEKARIIDAKLEQACLFRDRMRIETEISKKKTWFEKSNDQFREVAKAAEEAGIHYRLVDAVCNRVWLGYYANEMEQADQAASEVETLDVLKPYWLKDGEFADKAQAYKNPILWAQIGKYCVGQGMVELEKWRKDKKDKFFKAAARYMMLGLTYSTTFAEDHRGLREGRRTIYQKLAPLNPDELKQFSGYVLDAESSEKIPNTPSALQLLMRDHALWFAE
jgi:hypothetical protein